MPEKSKSNVRYIENYLPNRTAPEAFRQELTIRPQATEHIAPRSTLTTSFDDLYLATDDNLALRIRQTLVENYNRLRAARNSDPMDADDAISRLKVSLADLFAYQGIAPGLEMAIVALYHSLQNRHGMALSADEYIEITSIVRRLSETPSLSVANALNLVEALQTKGFNTRFRESEILAEAFNE